MKTAVNEQNVAAPVAPATATHQGILGGLLTEISAYLRTRDPKWRAMPGPFAVFPESGGERQILYPDISVICRDAFLREDGCHGAPDWVIEVVSPDSRRQDYGKKLGIYISAGVREYWIADPERQLVVTYCLEQADVPVLHPFGDRISPGIFRDLSIDTSLFFGFLCAPENADDRTVTGQNRPAAASDADADRTPKASLSSRETRDIPGSGAENHSVLSPMTEPEITAYLEEHFASLAAAKNKSQLLKAAMGDLRGRAETRLINEAVARLCG